MLTVKSIFQSVFNSHKIACTPVNGCLTSAMVKSVCGGEDIHIWKWEI